MSQPFVGEIKMFGGNFAPQGWMFCQGQLLAISQHSALFSILGTTYGGDGRTTFALPDLRGRAPIQQGNGPGLTPIALGQRSGNETNTLTVNQIPAHNHSMSVLSEDADQESPSGNLLAVTSEDVYAESSSSGSLYGDGTGNTGGGQAVNNMMPSAVVSYVIAIIGIYPSRF